jgi:cytochrome c
VLKKINFYYLFLLISTFSFFSCNSTKKDTKILVFSKTLGYRHESIEVGKKALAKLALENDIKIDTTEDSKIFNERDLKNYSAIVFLSTTGDVLNFNEQVELQRYIQAGGGFVGIHAATDTEYEWPWFNKLVGAYFLSHPKTQKATINIIDHDHPSTKTLPNVWKRVDEWYNFKSISDSLNFLANLDEKSYEGGVHGAKHPIAWYHSFEGGRAFYTGLGHTPESYTEPLFLEHILGGIKYAIGENDIDYKRTKIASVPSADRFVKVVFAEKLDEPMELVVTSKGTIYYVQRKGEIMMYSPATQKLKLVHKLDVFTKHEDGLLGMALDPNFDRNNFVYIMYSPNGQRSVQNISRFKLYEDNLDLTSEKVVLEIPVERSECCHSGGSLEFGPDGNLYIAVGDNTNAFRSNGYSPMDDRPGQTSFDAQRSAGNTNDLRGKILRIHPEADGTYSIPHGNLFAKNQANTKPEIYIMGCRNPYRISIDQKTNYLYWGDVGPDAGKDSLQGPRGHDEVNQARVAGNHGWPYFVANNKPYAQVDFATNAIGGSQNPAKPFNNSRNNTGLKVLPPAKIPFIWYPYTKSTEFPEVGQNARCAMAGPVYHFDNYPNSSGKFPRYYDKSLIIYDWARDWIMAVRQDEKGNFKSLEHLFPTMEFDHPTDLEFGPDGALYLLEYGNLWFAQDDNARLVKIEYVAGNRPPVAKAKALGEFQGEAPLKVKFSGQGSYDLDKDDIIYEWRFSGKAIKSRDINAEFTFEKPGVYTPTLTVTDVHGNSSVATVDVTVGNSVPQVYIQTKTNRTFYWDKYPIVYQVDVKDKEDKTIDSSRINFFLDYLPEGKDMAEIMSGHQKAPVEKNTIDLPLINQSDCKACHSLKKRSVGPSFLEVATRYQNSDAVDKLANKIIKGGGGVWGDHAMSAHPQVSKEDAKAMVVYILSLTQEEKPINILKPAGVLNPNDHREKGNDGTYILSASYRDGGTKVMGPFTGKTSLSLRNPKIMAKDLGRLNEFKAWGYDIIEGVADGGYFYFNACDLTDISGLTYEYSATVPGKLEIHLNNPQGPVIGVAEFASTGVWNNWKPITTEIKETRGQYNLCFVYRKGGNHESNFLQIKSIYFNNKFSVGNVGKPLAKSSNPNK